MRIADAKGIVIVDGDSIMTSQFSVPACIDFAIPMLGSPPNLSVQNVATPGRTMAMAVSGFNANVLPFKSNGPINLVIIASALDGILSGASVVDDYANLLNYAALCKANGFRLIVGSCAPRIAISIQASFEQKRRSYNDAVRSTWQTFANGFSDIGGDPVIGKYSTALGTVFYVDGMHWTAAGASIAGGILAGAIKNELASRGFENKDVDSGTWQPTLINWNNTGSPTIEGTWTKSNGLVSVWVKVTTPAGTTLACTSGSSSIGNLPFRPLVDGYPADTIDDNQSIYIGGGAVGKNALWPATVNIVATSPRAVVISATYPTSE